MTKEFTREGKKYQAVQWTGANHEEIISFVGPEYTVTSYGQQLNIEEKFRGKNIAHTGLMVPLNAYVLKGDGDNVFWESSQVMHELYILVTTKLPLGVIPAYMVHQDRLAQLSDAIERYKEAGKEFPNGWETELKYLQEVVDRSRPTEAVTVSWLKDEGFVAGLNENEFVHPESKYFYVWEERSGKFAIAMYSANKGECSCILVRDIETKDQFKVAWGVLMGRLPERSDDTLVRVYDWLMGRRRKKKRKRGKQKQTPCPRKLNRRLQKDSKNLPLQNTTLRCWIFWSKESHLTRYRKN